MAVAYFVLAFLFDIIGKALSWSLYFGFLMVVCFVASLMSAGGLFE